MSQIQKILLRAGILVGSLATYAYCVGPVLAGTYLRKQIDQAPISGGKFSAVLGQEHLQSVPSTAPAICKSEKIAKVMWLLDAASPEPEWVETGSVKVWTNVSGGTVTKDPTTYHAGSYFARQKIVNGVPVYYRQYVGASGATGVKNYQITYGGLISGKHYWNFYVDGVLAGSLDYTRGSFRYMQIGIESSTNTFNTFFNGTVSDSVQWRNGNATWNNWSTSLIQPGDSPDAQAVGWSSTYTGTNNRVIFNKPAGSIPYVCP
jgi:hypothetical protein